MLGRGNRVKIKHLYYKSLVMSACSYNNSPSGYFFTILTFSVVTRKATSQSVSNHGRKYLAHGSTCILDNNGKTLQNVPGSYQYLSENGVIAIIFT